jgi:XTP/dITP diphosphohydrolase
MINKLLIATTRKGKIEEIKEVLKDLKLQLLTLKDIGFFHTEPAEVGKTYRANAIIKAKFYGNKTNLPTYSDDTGLEVDTLPNKLGLKSKRYTYGTDQDRVQKLLSEMKNIPKNKRTARFITVTALYHPQSKKVVTFRGVCHGKITHQAKGVNGFGYDPIFIPQGLAKTNAQLTLGEKNKYSSRSKAVRKLRNYLGNKKYVIRLLGY